MVPQCHSSPHRFSAAYDSRSGEPAERMSGRVCACFTRTQVLSRSFVLIEAYDAVST